MALNHPFSAYSTALLVIGIVLASVACGPSSGTKPDLGEKPEALAISGAVLDFSTRHPGTGKVRTDILGNMYVVANDSGPDPRVPPYLGVVFSRINTDGTLGWQTRFTPEVVGAYFSIRDFHVDANGVLLAFGVLGMFEHEALGIEAGPFFMALDAQGELITAFNLTAVENEGPSSLVVDAMGRIHFIYTRGSILRMEPDWTTFHPVISLEWTQWGFINDATVDREGRVWMVGTTEGGLPIRNAIQPEVAGDRDGFIIAVGADGEHRRGRILRDELERRARFLGDFGRFPGELRALQGYLCVWIRSLLSLVPVARCRADGSACSGAGA